MGMRKTKAEMRLARSRGTEARWRQGFDSQQRREEAERRLRLPGAADLLRRPAARLQEAP